MFVLTLLILCASIKFGQNNTDNFFFLSLQDSKQLVCLLVTYHTKHLGYLHAITRYQYMESKVNKVSKYNNVNHKQV